MNQDRELYFYKYLSNSVVCQVLVEVTKGSEITEKHVLYTKTQRRPELGPGGKCLWTRETAEEEMHQKRVGGL